MLLQLHQKNAGNTVFVQKHKSSDEFDIKLEEKKSFSCSQK